MSRRLVIAGLGNYTHPLTRHSIGQLLLKNLALKAARAPASSGSSTMLLNKKHPAWTTIITVQHPSGLLPPLELLFCLPRQYMNINGPAVISAANSFLPHPYSTYSILTLQDDLDLPPLSYKLQKGGGPRGHNGVRSISKSLPPSQSRDFYRVRLGIGRPENRSDVAGWVLGALGREEVEGVEWDEERGRGGEVLEKVWEEILRIGWAGAEEEV